MFIKEISDEAYLAFQMKYGEYHHVTDFYIVPTLRFKNEKETTVSELVGYISVEGATSAFDNGPVLLYEPSLNAYLVPIRTSQRRKVLELNRIRIKDKVVIFQNTQSLSKEEEENLETGNVSATLTKFEDRYSVTMKR